MRSTILKRTFEKLNLPQIKQISSYDGPSYEAVKSIRKQNLNPAMLTYYREPLLIHSGEAKNLNLGDHLLN